MTGANSFKKKRIRIGAYAPISHPDERHVKELAEAGVDFAILEFKLIKESAITPEFMSWFSKYGIDFTVDDPKTNKQICGGDVLDFEKEALMFYQNESGYVSYCYVDEPGMSLFPELGEEVRRFNEKYPDKFAFINLLPLYANEQQLKGGAWAAPIEYYDLDFSIYEQYLAEYVKYVDTHYICVDIYPCKCRPDPNAPDRYPLKHVKVCYRDYVKSIEYVANAARNSGRELWLCLQSCTWSQSARPVNGDELKWQAYTCLSYGATMLLYYVFGARPGHDYSMIDFRGERTQLYFDSKEMAEGLKKLSDVFVSYKNLGAFNVNSDPETTPYLEMNTPYTDFNVISEISADIPLLVGCFEKDGGKGNAFTLVNMQDFQTPKNGTVKLKINGKVTVYREGEPLVLTEDHGYYTVDLRQGEGVFATIE